MQASEVSGFAVRCLSGNAAVRCRTNSRTLSGQLSLNRNKTRGLLLSGRVSGAVRLYPIARCLSGCVSLGRARPDTRTDKTKKEVK